MNASEHESPTARETEAQPAPESPIPEAQRQKVPGGTRHRMMRSSAPAPVPEIPQPAENIVTEDRSHLTRFYGKKTASTAQRDAEAAKPSQSKASPSSKNGKTSDADVVRSTGSMAIATLFSRITGFLRNVMITATLGGAIASAFNTANTLPNLITEIVLGAVLTSLVVPVLVRAEKEDPDRGEAFIRRLFTLAGSILALVTVLAVVGAPWLMQIMLSSESKVNVTQATSFAYLLLPQIFFYGIFALLMAVLNTKEVFRPGAWAPVANNVITLIVLGLYMFLPGQLHPHDQSGVSDPHILLLGLGTTLGVIVQALIMVPPIRRAGISLKPLWGIDNRLKAFGGMAVAIVVYVAVSQFGYVITTRIAASSDEAAPNIYQQHWLLLQVPYGIIGVTLLTAIMPRLSRNAADGDDKAVVHDLSVATKLTAIALVPIVVFFTAFGEMIAQGLFAYGNFDLHHASILGWTLSFSAFTLIPYALVLLHLRVFYAREEAWTPTAIIAAITITKIILSLLAPQIAADPDRVVVLLGAANGFGFVAGALIGGLLLHRKLGNLGMGAVAKTSLWALGASLAGVLVCIPLSKLLHGVLDTSAADMAQRSSLIILLHLAIVGVVFLIITGLVLSRSRLPEVQALGRVAQRIPGLRKFVRVSPEPAKPVATETTLASNLFAFDDTFNATPVPPPMSAGIVRGPRLVPGARVSDGRFRLLADHGSVPMARFWHAQELSTGREVALVFIDTSGNAPQAPASPAAAAGAAAEISRRTRKLAALEHPAIAQNIEVLSYRNGALVVADWVPGTSLASVAESGADPYAAAYAFAPLSEAYEAAVAAHVPLGLDNRARIRISTAGVATLAFPAVLPDASFERDQRNLRTALHGLVNADEAPTEIRQLFEVPVAELPQALENLPEREDAPDEQLTVAADEAPQPADEPGFGSKRPTRWGLAMLMATIVALVVLIAAMSSWITSIFGNKDDNLPVTSDSLIRSSAPATPPVAIVAPLEEVHAFHRGQEQIAAVAEETAPNLLQDHGVWSSGVYASDLGNTNSVSGVGVLLHLQRAAQVQEVMFDASGAPFQVELYALPSLNAGLDEGELLGSATASNFRTSIPVENPDKYEYLVLWITDLPAGVEAQIRNLDIVALHQR